MIAFLAALAVILAQGPPRPVQVDPQAIFNRAIADFENGRVRESAEGFDLLAEIIPENVPRLWQRAIVLYYEGRFKDCARQLAAHWKVNRPDAENAAWYFACVARGESLRKARESIPPIVHDPRTPWADIYDLLRELTTPERLMEAALATGRLDAEFDAHLYLGLYYEALGDTERTRIHITAAAADRFKNVGLFMHAAARVHLQQLRRRR